MPRNWQGIFQKGQPLENSTIANLQALETDVASALATSGVTSVYTRTGAVTAADGDYNGVVASAKTGATAATRYVGATASGAPASGTFAVGDFVVAQNGHIFICTVAGTPGTWVDVGSVANQVTSVFTRTGAVVATSGDYTAAQVTNAADKSSASQQTFTGNVSSPVHIAAGITGATAASRYVGATASGAPASGTFSVGDHVIDQAGSFWVCTSAGTPGTWVQVTAAALASGTLTNAMVNAAAAIAYSKLNLASSIVNADISASAAIAYSKLNLGTSIVNADVSTSAAIAVSKLAAGTAGQVLGGTGPSYALPPGYEINYTQITSNVTVASTTESSGTTVISPGAITFDGAAVMVEFFTPFVFTPSTAGQEVFVSLFEGGTQIGRLLVVNQNATGNGRFPSVGRLRFTPTSGSHTYTVTAFVTDTTGTPQIGAGAGGTGAFAPAFVRFTKV